MLLLECPAPLHVVVVVVVIVVVVEKRYDFRLEKLNNIGSNRKREREWLKQ